MINKITYNGSILAIIIPHDFIKNGIEFCTPDEFSQQMAYMSHPKDKIIQPHIHNPVKRDVQYTLEVLFIKRGKLRVDFYNENQEHIESHVLVAGDTILLASGGHGFEVLEDLEMIEVKQGPFAGDQDKTRFIPKSGPAM